MSDEVTEKLHRFGYKAKRCFVEIEDDDAKTIDKFRITEMTGEQRQSHFDFRRGKQIWDEKAKLFVIKDTKGINEDLISRCMEKLEVSPVGETWKSISRETIEKFRGGLIDDLVELCEKISYLRPKEGEAEKKDNSTATDTSGTE